MELNTDRIMRRLGRFGWSMARLGREVRPPVSRQAIWQIMKKRRASWNMVDQMAKVLDLKLNAMIIWNQPAHTTGKSQKV